METEIVRLHREGKRAESLRQFAGGKRVRGFRSRDRRRSHVRVYLAVPQCERKGRRSRIDGFCLSDPSHELALMSPQPAQALCWAGLPSRPLLSITPQTS
jgi:hypothetical protein